MSDTNWAIDGQALALLDAVPERILVCDAQGTVLHAHPLARALLGVDELRGAALPQWLVELDGAPATLSRLSGVVAHGPDVSVPAVLRHARGVALHLLLVAREHTLAGRQLWLISLRDRPAEDPRARQDDVYRTVFERAPVGIFHVDERGIITAVNDAFAAIIGSPRRVLVGLAIRSLPDRNIVECLELSLRGEVARYEGPYRSATGQRTTEVRLVFAPSFDAAGAVTGSVGIVADITAHKETERALTRSLSALHTVIEHAPDAIAVHHEGRFVLVNSRMAETVGARSADELLGREVGEFIHPDEHETMNARLTGLTPGIALRPQEYRMRRANGTWVRVEVKSIAIEHDGKPSVLVFGRDVTERRELEARLAQADRMASVGTLAAGVAHEINNPLGYVMMTAELLVRRLAAGKSEGLSDGLTRIQEGCDRIRTIVRDLSTFSRRSDDILTSVEVNQAVTTSVNMVRHTVRHKAQLVVDLAPELPRVRGDQARLGQVFINLLVNAAQAIPDGNPEQHTVRISTESDGVRVRVRVQDDGEGMAPHVEQRIFEPFFTTKAPGVGSGLGLAICHGIVRSHGGVVRVRTQPGKGSEFIVDLPGESHAPLRTSLLPPPTVVVVHEAPASHILIVDDEAAYAEALRDTLADRHQVTIVASGRAAVEALLERAEPDLVLCDVMMPDITGLGVFEIIQEQRPHLAGRFVFMTGGAVTERAREMLEFTDRPVLYKPFQRGEVERLLGSLRESTPRTV